MLRSYWRIAGILLLIGVACPRSFNAYLNTSAYSFARQNPGDSTLTHVRVYESFMIRGNDVLLKGSRLTISGVFYLDPVNAFDVDPVFNMYNVVYSTVWMQRKLQVHLGRQFIYAVSDVARMDGLKVTYNRKKMSLLGFAGGYVPASGWTSDPINSHFWGMQLGWKATSALDLKAGLSQKAHSRTYGTERSPQEVSPNLRSLLGVQGTFRKSRWTTFVRMRNYTNDFSISDFVIHGNYRGSSQTPLQSLALEYQYRTPRIPENSIFSVFNSSASSEVRLSGRNQLTDRVQGSFSFRHVWFSGESADIVSIGVNHTNFAVNVIRQEGYGGSSNRLVVGIRKPWEKLSLAARTTIGNYRLLEGNWDDLSTVSLTGEYLLTDRLTLRSEVHVLRNPYYTNDTRFQLGLRVRI
ncbi:MAG: hypothetical protein GXO90_03725 [FCB group bacterium]|nr:hypothetical protein [FCB group bacterium]